MTFSFLGSGNMASAIVKGIVKSNCAKPNEVLIYDVSDMAANALCEACGVSRAKTIEELIEVADYLFIAIKPQVCREVLPKIGGVIGKHSPVVVSMAAGLSLATLEQLFGLGFAPRLVRMMPNINAMIGESVTAVCKNDLVSDDDFKTVTDLLKTIGEVYQMEEKFFGIFTAMASNSPAFTYLFIDALATGAQKLGMNKKLALEIAARACVGSAKMLVQSGEHPRELVDQVSSPAGSTIEGVCSLTESGFEAAIVKAVCACVEKDKKLNG